MRLSDLQHYILQKTFMYGSRCPRSVFETFYAKAGTEEHQTITVSIERLVAKGLLKGYGYKTAEKLFLDHVSLTPHGRREAKRLMRERGRLPLGKGTKNKRQVTGKLQQ